MIISNRMPKVHQFGTPKNKRIKEYKPTVENKELIYRGLENVSHPVLREAQRYGTLSVNRQAIVDSICNGDSIIIKQDSNAVTALVRYSNRYYLAVMDTELKVIKTFLPESSCSNFLDYVQMLIDKEENANKLDIAA